MMINNNIDDQVARPLNSVFTNQLKCIIGMKLRIFVLKVGTLGTHLTFLRA